MHPTVGSIADLINTRLAPKGWAEDWDNVGLLVGNGERPVKRVLVALDLTDGVIDEALAAGAQLIVTHHPLIFKPLKALRLDGPEGRRLERLIKHDLAVIAAHTNFDQAAGGTNEVLAGLLGLQDPQIIAPNGEEKYLKLVVFVPESHIEAVREALAEAGCGALGNYSHCTFQTLGTGTFKPLTGADPFIGAVGTLERTPEYRLETILPANRAKQALAALFAAHPYEEPAYDLYPIDNIGQPRGHGRIGNLPAPTTVGELAARLKGLLPTRAVRVVGGLGKPVTRAAVGPGSGGMLIKGAAALKADVLVAGDIDYHDAQAALDHGLAIIDPGHFATEVVAMASLAEGLQKALAGKAVTVTVSTSEWDPFQSV